MAEAEAPVFQEQQVPLPNAVAADELLALLEALLLVAPDPVEPRDLARAASVPVSEIERALDAMNDSSRGWVVVRHNGAVQLTSAPRFAPQVRAFLRLEREARLSGAALETLALIAYRQPVTRAEIDALRGVDSSGVLATLHARGLIEIVGRLPTIGNPLQYATSIEFLRQFGLSSLAELPPLNELSERAADRLFEEVVIAEAPTGEPAPNGQEPAD